MNPFYKPQYTSEITDFITALKQDNPGLEAEQRRGRALLWDKTLDLQTQSDFAAATVPQTPYVYQSKV